jgi:hypothetical protein
MLYDAFIMFVIVLCNNSKKWNNVLSVWRQQIIPQIHAKVDEYLLGISLALFYTPISIVTYRLYCYEKCALTSCNLSSEPLFLQSSEKEGSVTMLCKKVKSSVVVTPCFRSYSILLHTFIILPYFWYSFFSYLGASSGKPFTYFKIVCCMCLRCHSLNGKIFVFSIKNCRKYYTLKMHIILRIFNSGFRQTANIITKQRSKFGKRQYQITMTIREI